MDENRGRLRILRRPEPGGGESIVVVDAATGRELWRPGASRCSTGGRYFLSPLHRLLFHSSSTRCMGEVDRRLDVHDAASGEQVQSFTDLAEGELALSSDERHLYVRSEAASGKGRRKNVEASTVLDLRTGATVEGRDDGGALWRTGVPLTDMDDGWNAREVTDLARQDLLKPGMTVGGRFGVLGERPGWTLSPGYDAYDREAGRRVLLRILDGRAAVARVHGRKASGIHLSLAEDAFEREASTLLRFRHPNVAQLLAWGRVEAGPAFYAAFEPVEGVPLDEYLRTPLGVRAAADLFGGLLDGLAALRKLQFDHGWIVPSNVVVTGVAPQRFVLVGLLGTAVRGLVFGAAAREGRVGWQAPGALAAAPYLAPEVHGGDPKAVGVRCAWEADVFSVTRLLIQALLGTWPAPASFAEAARAVADACTLPAELTGHPFAAALRAVFDPRAHTSRPTAAELRDRLRAVSGTAEPKA
ncbi:MAG: hypothetical protein HYZ53_18240 [Planctomycetes bacterium]|nr:hypothetical protein [Planctomycetota bacterium]